MNSNCCIPTVGAMHGGFICQAIAGRIRKESDTILYLDPGFPVNKLQTKFLGLQESSIDLYDYLTSQGIQNFCTLDSDIMILLRLKDLSENWI